MNEIALQPPRFLSGEWFGFLEFSTTSISGDEHNDLKKSYYLEDAEDCLYYDWSLKFRVNRMHRMWFFLGRIALEVMYSD